MAPVSAVSPAEAAEVVQDVMDMANMVAPPVLLRTRIKGLSTHPPLSTEDESTMLNSSRSKDARQTGSGETHMPVAGETDSGSDCTFRAAEAAAVGHGAAQVPPEDETARILQGTGIEGFKLSGSSKLWILPSAFIRWWCTIPTSKAVKLYRSTFS